MMTRLYLEIGADPGPQAASGSAVHAGRAKLRGLLALTAFAALSPIALGNEASRLPLPLQPATGQACWLYDAPETNALVATLSAGHPPISALPQPLAIEKVNHAERPEEPKGGIHWGAVLKQSQTFLAIQHGVRIASQQKTRSQLRGPFFADYAASVRGLSGWDDGDSWKTNYVGHPMQGSISGFIFTQNDMLGKSLEFSSSGVYWKSRLRAMAFNAAYSTHYELSPLGEAGIGNVGMKPGTKGAVDLVITPTLGAAWMVTEDLLDAKVIAKLEQRIHSPVAKLMMRSLLNPTRSFANLLRGAYPWHRDTRGGVR